MNKKPVWVMALAALLLMVGSVGYSIFFPAAFDPADWRAADSNRDFGARARMLRDVTRMIDQGQISSQQTAERLLGPPQKISADNENVWLYEVGGGKGGNASGIRSWLELTFDMHGQLVGRRITQD